MREPDAPREVRIANSRSRREARINCRFATFAHAIRRTRPTAPRKSNRGKRALAMMESPRGRTSKYLSGGIAPGYLSRKVSAAFFSWAFAWFRLTYDFSL